MRLPHTHAKSNIERICPSVAKNNLYNRISEMDRKILRKYAQKYSVNFFHCDITLDYTLATQNDIKQSP